MTALEEKLTDIIENKINPQLNLHDGRLALREVNGNTVSVRFLGACATCMMMEDTFENFVRDTLLAEMPEIKEVVVDNSPSQDLLDFAKKLLSKDK